jgi:hypothetical protein
MKKHFGGANQKRSSPTSILVEFGLTIGSAPLNAWRT